MSQPESISQELGRIEVQDQSPDPVPIEVKRGIGHRILDKLGVDSTLHDSPSIMRTSEAQRAQDIAAQPNAPTELDASPIEAKRASQLIENTQGNIKSYDKDAALLSATDDKKLL